MLKRRRKPGGAYASDSASASDRKHDTSTTTAGSRGSSGKGLRHLTCDKEEEKTRTPVSLIFGEHSESSK